MYSRERLQRQYDALQRREQEVEAVLEQYYPANIAELTQLVGLSEEDVQRRIEYIAREQKESKYVTLNTILTFHRIQWGRK